MGKHKKIIAICLCAVIVIGAGAFAGYKALNKTTLSLSNSTIAGQVTAINGNKITLQLGTLPEMNGGGMNGASGFTSLDGSGSSSDGQKQNEDSQSSGEAPSGTTPSDMPSGSSGTTPPDKPSEGDSPLQQPGSSSDSQQQGNQQSGMPQMEGNMGRGSMFISGGSTATLTIKNEELIKTETTDGTSSGSLEGIKEGSILEITFGRNNSIKSIVIKSDSSSLGSNGDSSTETNSSR